MLGNAGKDGLQMHKSPGALLPQGFKVQRQAEALRLIQSANRLPAFWGAISPRWRYAACVAIRPLGVRCK